MTEEGTSGALALPTSQHPVASVIVVGWRAASRLADCLRSLAAAAGATPFEVVVVLNEPSEALKAAAAAWRGVEVEVSGVNRGFPGACNVGAARARGRYLVLLNDDCEVQAGWLDELVATAEVHEQAGAVGSKVLNADGSLQEAGGLLWRDGSVTLVGHGQDPEQGAWNRLRRTDYCSAASLLVRREAWEAVDGLDERYSPGYYEDVDLCLKLAATGRTVLYQPASSVVHHLGSSSHAWYRQFLSLDHQAVLRQRWRALLDTLEEPGGEDELASALHRAEERPVWPEGVAPPPGAAATGAPYRPPPAEEVRARQLETAEAYAAHLEERLTEREVRLAELALEVRLLKEDQAHLIEQRESLNEAHHNWERHYAALLLDRDNLAEELRAASERLAAAEAELAAARRPLYRMGRSMLHAARRAGTEVRGRLHDEGAQPGGNRP